MHTTQLHVAFLSLCAYGTDEQYLKLCLHLLQSSPPFEDLDSVLMEPMSTICNSVSIFWNPHHLTPSIDSIHLAILHSRVGIIKLIPS